MILKNILFHLGIGNHKFDSEIWKTESNKRRLFAKNIISSEIAIGLNTAEAVALFGEDKVEFSNGIWSYKIDSFNKRVTTDGNTKSALILQFDDLGIIVDAKIKWYKRK